MREFTLGIIGGCLTHQAGVPKSELYHQRLKHRLAEAGRAQLKVRIARDFEREHVHRLESLIQENPIDAVMVHVRSAFVGKAALIVTTADNEEFRYYLHPFLLRPWKSGWAEVQESDFAGCTCILRRKHPLRELLKSQSEKASESGATDHLGDWGDVVPAATKIAGISLRDLFYLGGAFCGLDGWAIRDELRMLEDLRMRCAELGLPLFVLGPSRRPDNFWLDRLCRKLDARLREVCAAQSLPYSDLMRVFDEDGRRMYRPDGFHLTVEGHAYCANQLAGILEAWFDSKKTSDFASSHQEMLVRG